jgi:hypothetical protein
MDVQFQEDQFAQRNLLPAPPRASLIRLVQSFKWASNEKEATRILVGVTVVCVVVIVTIYVVGRRDDSLTPSQKAQLERVERILESRSRTP